MMPAALHAALGCGRGHDQLDCDARQQSVDFYNFLYAVLWAKRANAACTAAFARAQASCYAFAASACALCSKLEMSFSLRSSVRTSRLHLRNRRVSGETQRKAGQQAVCLHWAFGVLLQRLSPRFSTSGKMAMRASAAEGLRRCCT